MDIKQQYKRFKAWQQKAFDWSYDENEHHSCVNCGNGFVGNHCPHCSQKAGVGKVTWQSVLQSTAEVWGMNNRSLLYSLWQLMFRPGYFISDYINGKRQVSFPPVKMLVIMGFVGAIFDYLFSTTSITRKVVKEDSPLVNQYFDWLESSPGWGFLSIMCFFIIPTWCIFRYAPRNAKHSLPQGFFIQVFMSIQVLVIDNLADIFGDFFYIMVPMCYFYVYGQLFGYRIWGNIWRVILMLISGFVFTITAISITELLTIGPTVENRVFHTVCCAVLATVSMLVGMLLSKALAKRPRSYRSQH